MAKSKRKHPEGIQVDMVSDIVCPWCWLGKRYFDDAVKKSGAKVNVTYRPYMLDPTVPKDGMAYRDYMKAKFGEGPSDKFKAMRDHLEAAAPDAGINFKFSDIPVRPNTLRAHCLIKWAQGEDQPRGRAGAIKENLFKAFFDDLLDIGDIDVLSKIAGDNGMDAALVKDLLNQDRDIQAVMEEISFFRGLGISGVPTFIYNGQFAVQGGQPTEAHLKAIKQAQAMPAMQN